MSADYEHISNLNTFIEHYQNAKCSTLFNNISDILALPIA